MNRIKELRTRDKISQQKLANKLNVARSTVAMWETGGSQPNNNYLLDISKLFNVSVDYLLGKDNGENKDNLNKYYDGVKIPVLSHIYANVSMYDEENIIDYEEISPSMADQGDFFAMKISDDSMESMMFENDTIIVRSQTDIDSGDIAVVLINGGEASVKKVTKKDVGIFLTPINSSYDVMFFSSREVKQLPIRIVGKVVEIRRRL
ncbi:MAG: LexA family protein [Clostridia bacterium]